MCCHLQLWIVSAYSIFIGLIYTSNGETLCIIYYMHWTSVFSNGRSKKTQIIVGLWFQICGHELELLQHVKSACRTAFNEFYFRIYLMVPVTRHWVRGLGVRMLFLSNMMLVCRLFVECWFQRKEDQCDISLFKLSGNWFLVDVLGTHWTLLNGIKDMSSVITWSVTVFFITFTICCHVYERVKLVALTNCI